MTSMIRDGREATALAVAVARLRNGGLVALPTETVYGLAADATSDDALDRIFEVKGRPRDHPLIVHVPDLGSARSWAADFPVAALELAYRHWPGPLTLVLRKAPWVSPLVTGGQDTVALRVPGHPVALNVLRAFGEGLAAPSANRFGAVSPTTARHVEADLAERLDPTRDLILDGGPSEVGVESTIVDVTTDVPRVLRSGRVSLTDVLDPGSGEGGRVGRVPCAPSTPSTPRAPGMLDSHYAPRAHVLLVDALGLAGMLAGLPDDGRTGLIASADVSTPAGVSRLLAAGSVTHYARDLYRALRQADENALARVIAVLPASDQNGISDEPLALAIRDRLTRAAAPSHP